MERARDKPQLVRAGSLIRFNSDGDVGIVIQVLGPVRYEVGMSDHQGNMCPYQPLKVWWLRDNSTGVHTGIVEHDFEPFSDAETVLRY